MFHRLLLAILIIAFLFVPLYSVYTRYTHQNNQKQSNVKNVTEPGPVKVADAWKTYKNEAYGVEFKYPQTWNVQPLGTDTLQIRVGDVAIAGSISLVEAPSIDQNTIYKATNTSCPEIAGTRNLSSSSQYEEYVYCQTGVVFSGWREIVSCSGSQWYADQVDPETCSHEYWTFANGVLYIVHLNIFKPILAESEEEVFITKFLSSFIFK